MDVLERANREHETVTRLAAQEIFYNALLERLDDQDLLFEAFEEHTAVEGLLDGVETRGICDPRFGAGRPSKERF